MVKEYEKTIDDKTLYVCVNNVGRSQMAETFHNQMVRGSAESAGINVDEPGGVVRDWQGGADTICDVMEEIGLPISNNLRTQYDADTARNYAKTVFLLEPEQIPDSLHLDNGNIVYWPMDDPRDKSIEDVRMIREQIQKSVQILVSGLVQVKPCTFPA